SALLNLAINARDAMPDGGTLAIRTRVIGSGPLAEIEVSVTDTGIGMPPDVVEKAFQPFFTTKEIGKGTGLGLSQVYGFIQQSGGHVSIESEVGRGTTIRLYLPRLTAAMPEAVTPIELPPSRTPTETILLVEDEH